MKKKYSAKIRVRYNETDQSGAVYFSNFFVWMDFAVAEFFRSLDIYDDLHEQSVSFVAGECSARYYNPAKYHDLLDVTLEVKKLGEKTIAFVFEVLRGKEKLADGGVLYIFTDSKRSKAVKVPDDVRNAMGKGGFIG
jgi:acyl-CoA thioester hydrolase